MPDTRQLFELKPVTVASAKRLSPALKILIGALIRLALFLLGRGHSNSQDQQPTQRTSTTQTTR